jgi:hypothetical protein
MEFVCDNKIDLITCRNINHRWREALDVYSPRAWYNSLDNISIQRIGWIILQIPLMNVNYMIINFHLNEDKFDHRAFAQEMLIQNMLDETRLLLSKSTKVNYHLLINRICLYCPNEVELVVSYAPRVDKLGALVEEKLRYASFVNIYQAIGNISKMENRQIFKDVFEGLSHSLEYYEKLEYLLDNGVDLNEVLMHRHMFLERAINVRNDTRLTKLLIKYGASLADCVSNFMYERRCNDLMDLLKQYSEDKINDMAAMVTSAVFRFLPEMNCLRDFYKLIDNLLYYKDATRYIPSFDRCVWEDHMIAEKLNNVGIFNRTDAFVRI